MFEKFEHTFRQSWLGTYFECPEQARLVLRGEYPPDQSEAALKGTAMHAGIEHVLRDGGNYQTGLTRALDTFEEGTLDSNLRWVQTLRAETCLRHVTNGFRLWYEGHYPTLGAAIWVEEGFKFLFHEDDRRRIFLSGTVDYAEATGLQDWKLTGNADKYGKDAWKLRRFGIQPTVYATAAYELGLFPPDQPIRFNFVAMPTTGSRIQVVDCYRSQQDVAWLKAQCVSIARHIEGGTEDLWPLRDQSALCSPKWCTAWSNCKGKYISD